MAEEKRKVKKRSKKVNKKTVKKVEVNGLLLENIAKSMDYTVYKFKDRIIYVLMLMAYFQQCMNRNKVVYIQDIGQVKFKQKCKVMEVRFEDRLADLLKGELLSYEEIKNLLWK
jgi:menaquinone-dependent protoporphyrinogen IX oxidase